MKNLVIKQLRDLGVPTHLKGYKYLEFAILKGIDADDDYLDGITKILYPKIAGVFHTQPNRVERDIRHAIEVSMTRGGKEVIAEIFGATINPVKNKVTNKEYLSGIINYLKCTARQ